MINVINECQSRTHIFYVDRKLAADLKLNESNQDLLENLSLFEGDSAVAWVLKVNNMAI